MNICSLLKDARREKGITQEKLCYGLCSKSMLSKIENGKKYPTEMLFTTLMERLGKDAERCNILGTTRDIQKKYARMRIAQCIRGCKYENLQKELMEYSTLYSKEDKLSRQFYLIGKAGDDVEYETLVEYCMQAIHITIPDFCLDRFKDFLYSYNELVILNMLAGAYRMKKEYLQAKKLYEEIFLYLQDRWEDTEKKRHLLLLVLSNLCNVEVFLKEYYEVLSNSNKGIKWSTEWGNFEYLYLFYYTQCETKLKLNYRKMSSEEMRFEVIKIYYACKMAGKESAAELIRREFENEYDIKFDVEFE